MRGFLLFEDQAISFPRLPAICAAILLLMPLPAAASGVADLLLLQSVEQRVAIIGHRLAMSAGDLCAQPAPLAGMQVHDASQYARGDAANLAAAFGGGAWPKVLAVVPGGAAARAGVQANDSILSIDGRTIPPASKRGYGRVSWTLALLDQGLADGHAVLALERDGKPLSVDLIADRGCGSRFQVKVSTDLQGKANGDYVEVTTGTVAFAPDDAELAVAIAHELAHNILHHRARLDAAGVTRGMLQNFGKSARLTKETEIEADRLSVYLLDRAGYRMEAALSFWARFRSQISSFLVGSHPSAKNRIAILQVEIAKIEAAKARGAVAGFN
jgi:hypothetical protein